MSGPLSGVVLQGAYPPAEFEGMVERIDALDLVSSGRHRCTGGRVFF